MTNKPTIFDDDFDEADHIGEVRKRPAPVPATPPPPVKPDTSPNKLINGGHVRDAARRVLASFGRGEF